MRLLLSALLSLAGCTPATVQLLTPAADAATALGGDGPWAITRVTLAGTTDFDIYTAQTWARQCVVKNEHASGVLVIGNYDETGAVDLADPTTDEFTSVAAGGAFTIPLSAGNPQADAVHRAIPLASSTASLVASIYCTASPE